MCSKVDVITLGDSPFAPEPETSRTPRKRAIPAKNRTSRNLFGVRRQAEELRRMPTSSRKRAHQTEALFDASEVPEAKRNRTFDEDACWQMAKEMVKKMNSATKKALLRENRESRRRRGDSDEEDHHNDYAKMVFNRYSSDDESPEKKPAEKPWPHMNFYGGMDPIQKENQSPNLSFTTSVSSSS